jgi:P-type Ca2+ transporter type 2C
VPLNNFNIQGLCQVEVLNSRIKHGNNTVKYHHGNTFLEALNGFFNDPMVALLLVASVIYFVSGQTGDGIFMVSAIVLVTGISMY